jgi:hypothetical protein
MPKAEHPTMERSRGGRHCISESPLSRVAAEERKEARGKKVAEEKKGGRGK